MLTGSADKIILPLNASDHTVIVKQRAIHNDVISSENIPEFNGFNTTLCRLAGLSVSPRIKVVHLPLIDMPHADPSTMMISLGI